MSQVIEIPHDPLNEQVVLAACLFDRRHRKRMLRRISADHFLVPEHGAVFAAIKDLVRDRKRVTLSAVRRRCSRSIDGSLLTALKGLGDAPPSLGQHVDALEFDRRRAEAVQGPLSALHEALQDITTPPERLEALGRQVAEAFRGGGGLKFLVGSDEVVRKAMADLQARREGKAIYPYGLEGLDHFDNGEPRMIPGAAPGRVTVVTAAPGCGKSTLVARIILELARMGRRVLYGAWEMSAAITLELLAIMSSGLSRTAVAVGDVGDDAAADLERRMGEISRFVRFMKIPSIDRRRDGRRGRDWDYGNEAVLDAIGATIAETSADVFVGDLFERCFVEGGPGAERSTLYGLQRMAEEEMFHALIAQQQNTKGQGKGTLKHGSRPTIGTIFGSQAWVDVGDTIIAPYRSALYKDVADDECEILILKQRFGRWPLAVLFDFDPDLGLYLNGREADFIHGGESADDAMGAWLKGG